jgi:N-acetylmuramoyl-L-alanine amidase
VDRRRSVAQALIGAALLQVALLPRAARAAAIDSVALTRESAVVQLRFNVRGRLTRFHVSTHDRELWIDLANAHIELPVRPLYGRESPPLESVRAIDRGGLRSRIVVGVSGKTDYAVALVGHAIVLRLAPAGQAANLSAPLLALDGYRRRPNRKSKSPSTRARVAYSVPAPARRTPAHPPSPISNPPAGRPLVMIDPGHGGYDPGTQSAAGVREKDLALEISLGLLNALRARGIRAELTRRGDYFVALPERTRLANLAHADLFVSIHLNSNPDPAATGIAVYYLDNTTDRATIRLARIENADAKGAGVPYNPNLNYILADLRQNYKATQAAALARMIDAQTVADLDAELGLNVDALGAKRGPFYVMVGANMPAVLIECGFLSNPIEAARLARPRYQQALARGVAEAIVHYFAADAAVGNL